MTAALTADFRTNPYWHQLKEFETSAELPARALLWQMRTGKTKVIIDTACHLYRQQKIDAVIVIAPNGVHDNWMERELPTHIWWDLPYRTLVWRSSSTGTAPTTMVKPEFKRFWLGARDALASPELLWVAINSEVLSRADVKGLVSDVVNKRRVMVVYDESHDFGSPGARRTKTARALAKHVPYRRILTGTPISNSPLTAFSQFELLQPGALGHDTYASFKARYAKFGQGYAPGGRPFPKLIGYDRLDELRTEVGKWSSVVLRDDCDDLPNLIRKTRPVEPTDDQMRIYQEARATALARVNGHLVRLGDDTAPLVRLQQIMCGYVVGEDGTHTIKGANPRLDAVADEVRLAPGPALIWCQFREDVRRVVARLKADGHEVMQYHGGTSNTDRQRVRRAFAGGAGGGGAKALVAQPQAGGRGLDLSSAAVVIWYSHTFDAIVRSQADERATKIGGRNIKVVDLVTPGLDPYILDTIQRKTSIADDVAGRGLRAILNDIAA